MKDVTVSVIIPTHNRAHLVGRAIRSVLAQTLPDFEVLVVDDASTDNTEEVVCGFGDPRIRYIRRETNGGGSAARNLGIRQAKGEFVTFLDSDDEWLPEKLHLQATALQDASGGPRTIGAVLGYGRRVDTEGPAPTPRPAVPEYSYAYMFTSGVSDWATLMVRRAYLDLVGGFDETLPASQWWDLCARLLQTGCRFHALGRTLAIYHEPNGPRIRTLDNRARAAELLLRKYRKGIPHRRLFHSRLHLTLARYHVDHGQTLPAWKEMAHSFLLYPSGGTALRLALSLAGARLYASALHLRSRLGSRRAA